MKKILSTLGGISLALVTVAIGIVTFIEKDQSTAAAFDLVYGAFWFELLLAICAITSLIRCFYFHPKKQIIEILLHSSIFIILLGSGITRYTGATGIVHIREGSGSNEMQMNTADGVVKKQLPFDLHLSDFQVETYPGSQMPSMYRSIVTVKENGEPVLEYYSIHMNHILKYRGYRFYQSSYDQDQRGTILSVNHDPWGIAITYFGYTLICVVFLISLFIKQSPFKRILNNKHMKYATILLFVMLVSQTGLHAKTSKYTPNKNVASHFGTLWLQNNQERIKPINTFANEVVRKITSDGHYQTYSPEQLVLGIILDREFWRNEPLFDIPSKAIIKKYNLPSDRCSYNEFFTSQGRFKLEDDMRVAMDRNENQTQFDKDLSKLGERILIYHGIENMEMLKIYPDARDINGQWFSPTIFSLPNQQNNKHIHVLKVIAQGDDQKAIDAIDQLRAYQEHTSKDILPTAFQQSIELFYNKYVPYPWMFMVYFGLGIFLLIAFFVEIYTQNSNLKLLQFGKIILTTLFTIHLCFLILRMIISGHASMSNSYETLILIGALSLLSALIFAKQSTFVLASGSMVAGVSLLVASFSWMNPEITNLVPVLKSYWLSLHVSIIMISYATAGIAFISSITSLLLMVFSKKSTYHRITAGVDHLMVVNRLFTYLTVVFLCIGIILGAVWANESWGRYWSWDPKETWALISMLVYAGILHIKRLDTINYNTILALAFGTILMTYFGVNFYLGGKHSYAGSMHVSLPMIFAYFSVPILTISAIAQIRISKLNTESQSSTDR